MKRHSIFLETDLALQYIIVGINTVLLVAAYFLWFYLLYWQFLLGFYQFVLSAIPNLIWLLFRKDIHAAEQQVIHYRRLHFGVSVLVLSGFVVGANGGYDWLVSSGQVINWIFFIGGIFVIPQSLAYLYIWITWRHGKVLKQTMAHGPNH